MRNLELELYPKAMKLWGFKGQCLMMIEETSELQTSILHLFREYKNKTSEQTKQNFEQYIKEIVDVEIVLNCLKINLCDYDKQFFEEYKTKRLRRLDDLILKGEKQ